MASKDPIYKQIEDSADYHQPATYDLLTFHNSMFETENDPLANDYVPLTGTLLPNKTQVIPFVIGLLPPTSPVTGRLLDRSASLAAMEGEGAITQEGLPTPPSNPKGTKWSSQAKPEQSFYNDFVKWCKSKGLNPIDMIRVATNESGFNPNSKNPGPAGARGLWQFMPDTAVPKYMDQATFDNFQNLTATQQLPYFQKFFGGLKSGASREEMYKYTFLPGATVGSDGTLYLPNGRPVSKGTAQYDSNWILDTNKDGTITLSDLRAASDYKLNSWVEAGLVTALGSRAELDRYYAESAANVKLPIGGDVAETTTNWATDGSEAASTAQAAQAKAAGKNFKGIDRNQSQQGQKFQAQQRSIIRALQIAEEQMAKTPPLRLLLNPESFKVASQKIISDGNWGRNGAGVGIEHWGDGQDVISASGKIAGFYAQDAVGTVNGSAGNSPGLTRMARAFSASYANFLSLYLIYRNNGGVWLEDFADSRAVGTTKPNNLAVVGSVYIYYDSTLYVGSFNSFEMSEEDKGPFTLSYSFEFTVRATYLLDRAGATNPNPGPEYGYPNFPQSNPFSTPTATARTQTPATGASVAIPAGTKTTDGRG